MFFLKGDENMEGAFYPFRKVIYMCISEENM